ncbi:polysaccharide lyase family 1 protein [Dactylosporangium sp. NPDC051541]|uniref:polysaccharide lyase family 1 protein n=1 Tax=Dactylosporangium sp. NPDC051541 TaxID=3363977 RepID=UPI0037B9FA65
MRKAQLVQAGLATGAAVAVVVALASAASAATLFSDDFNDGNANGWSTSGGSWSAGSGAYAQSSSSASAKALAGSTTWSTTTVTARVTASTFGGSASRGIGVAARAQSSSNFYALVLTANAVQIRKGATTTLASAPFSAATGTAYTLSLAANGSALTGSVNGTQVVAATDTSYSTGRVGLLANYVAGAFDDVVVSDAAGPAPTSASPTPSVSTGPPPPVGSAVGWGAGTTGGAAGPTVTVSTFADFRAQAQAAGARTILVNGALTGSGTVEISADKTIRGVGANSGISGATLNIEDMAPANVIIQNLNIRGVLGNDAIQIENADHIWIDHNTMWSTIENDPDVYDGMIDITHAGDYVTVSWNIIRDHWKTSLVGHSDGNASEDTGHLRVTYHHNWFDNTFERSPRVRFGETVHVYNNYYTNINHNTSSYAIASTMNAGLLVEANVFENVQQACWSASGYADSAPGRLVARNNSLTNSGPCETNGTVAAIPYAYTAQDVSTVKASVTSGAGAGKL